MFIRVPSGVGSCPSRHYIRAPCHGDLAKPKLGLVTGNGGVVKEGKDVVGAMDEWMGRNRTELFSLAGHCWLADDCCMIFH
jgi:hypothetical protein